MLLPMAIMAKFNFTLHPHSPSVIIALGHRAPSCAIWCTIGPYHITGPTGHLWGATQSIHMLICKYNNTPYTSCTDPHNIHASVQQLHIYTCTFIASSSFIYVTQSDKTSLIAQKYTHMDNDIYLLFCVCYSNSVSFIELLRIFCIYDEVCAKIWCSEKDILNLKDSKLTQNFYGNKTGFVRLGHIYTFAKQYCK